MYFGNSLILFNLFKWILCLCFLFYTENLYSKQRIVYVKSNLFLNIECQQYQSFTVFVKKEIYVNEIHQK
ncbi:unnamed protein product [Paramecium sonneborni]|uniref:Uncharacterized protein n=1 Tax=Paramecium sonneborni TaxID=65129 RepID=A0A8S1QZH0_9CILI|nr:unnamed protein product [Paramecium sonneborni]